LGQCALVGGETAEMPDFYGADEYDMAGFCVGLVDREKMIDGSKIEEGNVVIGIPSSGIHSNGYSLVRKVFFDRLKLDVKDYVEELGETVGEALLRPTKIYTKAVLAVLNKMDVNGIIHITGGGFYENIPRIIPEGLGVEIDYGTWTVPPVFNFIQKAANIELEDMCSTFNMGVGLMMIVPADKVEECMGYLKEAGEEPNVIGRIVKGNGVTVNA